MSIGESFPLYMCKGKFHRFYNFTYSLIFDKKQVIDSCTFIEQIE